MALRNAFENLGLDSTLQAIRDRLPAALGGSGGVKVEQQGPVTVTQATASNLKVDLSGTAANATAIKVDASTTTQPISAVSLPLPAAAATSTKQSDGSAKTQVVDGSGNVIGSTTNALDVNIKSGGGGAVTIADGSDVALGATADASSANTVIGRLKKLISLIPTALGQTTKANSLAVTLASDQEAPYSALTLADFGEIQGNTAATQLSTVTSKWVKIKAQYDNVGRVYIGLSDVTKANGTADATSGWQLSGGEEMPWLPISNLNLLYLICDNAGDDISYMVLT